MKINRYGINVVFQFNNGFRNTRLQIAGFIRYILQQQGRIAVIVQYPDSRFEIIFHTMCDISLAKHRQLVDITIKTELLPYI